jgi:hypothetical protein
MGTIVSQKSFITQAATTEFTLTADVCTLSYFTSTMSGADLTISAIDWARGITIKVHMSWFAIACGSEDSILVLFLSTLASTRANIAIRICGTL